MSIDTSIPHSLIREPFPKTLKAILVTSFIKIASLKENYLSLSENYSMMKRLLYFMLTNLYQKLHLEKKRFQKKGSGIFPIDGVNKKIFVC